MATRSLNKVMLIGNIARDPELRYTPSGTAVCSFRIATNRSWVPSDGSERKEETEFHRIVAWNKLAELCSQLISKGRKVYIEGRLQTRSWETGEGEKKYTTEIIAEDMVLLDSKRNGAEGSSGDVGSQSNGGGVEFDDVEDKKEKPKKDEEKQPEEDEKDEKEEKKGKKGDKDKKDKGKEDEEEEIDIEDIPF